MGRSITNPGELGSMQLNEFAQYDIAEMYDAENGHTYYISLPRRFLFRRMFRLFLMLFVISFFTTGIFIIPLIPCYIIAFHKISIFANWCQTLNLSYKKIMVFFICVLLLFEVIAIFLRPMVWNLIISL